MNIQKYTSQNNKKGVQREIGSNPWSAPRTFLEEDWGAFEVKKNLLGGGLEPPCLAACAPQTHVSAISPPELVVRHYPSDSVFACKPDFRDFTAPIFIPVFFGMIWNRRFFSSGRALFHQRFRSSVRLFDRGEVRRARIQGVTRLRPYPSRVHE